MFVGYGRERLYLSPKSTLQNSTWYTHIRRFHRRNDDALSQGSQVDEWNNPHSDIFGDEVGMSQELPFNSVKFGGYFLHEVYNAHNLFYNSAYGGSGAQQVVSAGSKFRSGYFQQDDVAFYAQDDVHPIPQIHIIPGVRVVGFSTSYSDQAQRDFKFLPGVIYATHCSLFPQTPGSDPYHDIFGTPTTGPDGAITTDTGSQCGGHESRWAVEPSIDASVMPYEWLTIYGGYDVTYRSPALGGGGGLFQSVDPTYYTLAKAAYSQGGVKVHFENAPGLKNFIAGVNYFHLSYTNQEIDFETAAGVEVSGGGNSTYHGVDLFFDADPQSNLHFFLNFAGESTNFTNYIVGGPSLAECTAEGISCTSYNNLPVSYVPNYTLNTGAYYGIQHNHRVLVEPRFWIESTGSQHLWSNLAGAPTTQTMPAYTTVNFAVTAPITFEKQSFNLKVDMMNPREFAVRRVGIHLQRRLFLGSLPRSYGSERLHQRLPRSSTLHLWHSLLSILIVLIPAQSGRLRPFGAHSRSSVRGGCLTCRRPRGNHLVEPLSVRMITARMMSNGRKAGEADRSLC